MTFIPLSEPAGRGKQGCYGKSAPGAREKRREILTHASSHTRYRASPPGQRGRVAQCSGFAKRTGPESLAGDRSAGLFHTWPWLLANERGLDQPCEAQDSLQKSPP